MKRVNLFVIGAAKSGTTALYHYLDHHPEIFMCPVKEPHYFATVESSRSDKYAKPDPGKKYHSRIINDEDIYHSLFKQGQNHQYLGEASPSYLWDNKAAKNIYEYNPNAMIIAILRNPIDRAFSHFQMSYQLGLEKEAAFFSAIKKDDHEEHKVWGRDPLYIELGNYYTQLKRYADLFPEGQIKVIKSDDLKDSPKNCLNEITSFLSISEFKDVLSLSDIKKNTARQARFNCLRTLRNSWVRDVITYLGSEKMIRVMKKFFYKKNSNDPSKIDAESRDFLKKKYVDELKKLKEEFEIDFHI